MNSAELQERLAAYADGELGPAERAEIERHLASDAAARADVARWQSLRRAAQHGINSEPMPAGLEARIRAGLSAARPRRANTRIYRLGLSGLAVAAAVTLAFLYRPQDASATPVKTTDLARIYRNCAVMHRHDSLHVRGATTSAALAAVEKQADFACHLPDLGATGVYYLDGACACAPGNVHAVHAYYRSTASPENVVSAFAVDRPMRLCNCDGAPCPGCPGARKYVVGHDEDVTLVGWQEGRQSYVLAARMDEQQLRALADGVRIARLHRTRGFGPVGFMYASRP